jgi:hypothetical protein
MTNCGERKFDPKDRTGERGKWDSEENRSLIYLLIVSNREHIALNYYIVFMRLEAVIA